MVAVAGVMLLSRVSVPVSVRTAALIMPPANDTALQGQERRE